MVLFMALPFGLLKAKNIDIVAEAIHAFEEYLCAINYFNVYEDGVWVGVGSVSTYCNVYGQPIYYVYDMPPPNP